MNWLESSDPRLSATWLLLQYASITDYTNDTSSVRKHASGEAKDSDPLDKHAATRAGKVDHDDSRGSRTAIPTGRSQWSSTQRGSQPKKKNDEKTTTYALNVEKQDIGRVSATIGATTQNHGRVSETTDAITQGHNSYGQPRTRFDPNNSEPLTTRDS
jgi:hypothetical protein